MTINSKKYTTRKYCDTINLQENGTQLNDKRMGQN